MELRKEKFVIPAGNRPFDRLKDETVIMVTGMHWKAYLLPIFVLALTTTFAFTKVLAGPQEPIFNAWIRLFSGEMFVSHGYTALIISHMEMLVVLALMILSLISMLGKSATTYVITNLRVIKSWGILKYGSSQLQLSRCKAVDIRQDVIARICGTSDVIVSSPETIIHFQNVDNYRLFANTIQEKVSHSKTD